MRTKLWALISVSFLPMVGCGAESGAEKTDEFRAVVEAPYATEIAIRNPAGDFVYVRGNDLTCVGTTYENGRVVVIPSAAVGIVWKDGVSHLVNAFQENGTYTIFTSDNLETELQNSFSREFAMKYDANDELRQAPKSGCDVGEVSSPR